MSLVHPLSIASASNFLEALFVVQCVGRSLRRLIESVTLWNDLWLLNIAIVSSHNGIKSVLFYI